VLRAARAYQLVQPKGAFITGRSAAVVFGAPVRPGPLLEVGVVSPQRAPRAKGVHGRRIADHLVDVIEHDGLAISSPATTWAMLCRGMTVRELVQIGDWMVRVPRDARGTPHPAGRLATPDDLRAAAEAGPRPPGTQRLRAALERISVGSSSPRETDFRLAWLDAGLPAPTLDCVIRDHSRRMLGISEFLFEEYGVVVEIEGDHHRTSRDQWNRDIQKYRDYEEVGLTVVRITAADQYGDDSKAIALVRAALQRRGWTPSRNA
jgi:hypothetical protein